MSRLKKFIEAGGSISEWQKVRSGAAKADDAAARVDVNVNVKSADDAATSKAAPAAPAAPTTPTEKPKTPWLKRAGAGLLAATGLATVVAATSEHGIGGFFSAMGNKYDKLVTGTEIGVKDKGYLLDIQSGQIAAPQEQTQRKNLKEQDVKAITGAYLDDYIQFASDPELNSQSSVPRLNERQATALKNVFQASAETAIAKQKDAETGAVSKLAGRTAEFSLSDKKDVDDFMATFKASASDKLKDTGLPEKTKSQVMELIFSNFDNEEASSMAVKMSKIVAPQKGPERMP